MDIDMPIPTPAELRAAARASLETHTVWEVAFHEAGHAMVLIDAGRFPEVVYINDDLADASHAGRNLVSMWLPSEWPSSPERAVLEVEARLLAAVLLGGDVAQARACGSADESGTDHDWAQIVLYEEPDDADGEQLVGIMSALDGDEAIELLVDSRREAQTVLDRRWLDVRRVAGRLVRDRRLDREDLWAMFPGDDSV